MPFLENSHLLSYLPATLKHDTNGWYVEYFVSSPLDGQLKRVRMKLNKVRKRYSSLTEFKTYAHSIVIQINNKLATGWSPFNATDNLRMYIPLKEVLTYFLDECAKELRPDTMRSYKSFCHIFGTWLEDEAPGLHAGSFNKVMAVRYMDYFYTGRKSIVSAVTFNNQLKIARSFFNWCIDKCYTNINPFETIRKKRTETKKRILIPSDARTRIVEYWQERKPGYVILCQLVFTSLIRPKEILMIKIRDINLSKKYIVIPASNAKTHKARFSTLSDELCQLLTDMQLDKYPDNYYLLSTGYVPGKNSILTSQTRKDWDKMRKALDLPQEMQLYSLRDSGINSLLKEGVDALTVMQHADHHDLSITTRYASHVDPKLISIINEKAPKF